MEFGQALASGDRTQLLGQFRRTVLMARQRRIAMTGETVSNEFVAIHHPGERAETRIEIAECLDRAFHHPGRITERARQMLAEIPPDALSAGLPNDNRLDLLRPLLPTDVRPLARAAR